MTQRIRHERQGCLGVVTLDAGALNILGLEDLQALERAVLELRDCPVVLLQATGERAFCAGMEVADHTPERAPAMLSALELVAQAFRRSDSVFIAKVAAPALGGGFELVLLCDLVVCSERAGFALPEITLAALPPLACELLPALVGAQRAADLILTGRRLDAKTAEAWGLVSRCVPPDALDEASSGLCNQLLLLSHDALRCCKRGLRARSLEEALNVYTGALLQTRDAAEGIDAFLQRRTPQWTWSLHTEELSR